MTRITTSVLVALAIACFSVTACAGVEGPDEVEYVIRKGDEMERIQARADTVQKRVLMRVRKFKGDSQTTAFADELQLPSWDCKIFSARSWTCIRTDQTGVYSYSLDSDVIEYRTNLMKPDYKGYEETKTLYAREAVKP